VRLHVDRIYDAHLLNSIFNHQYQDGRRIWRYNIQDQTTTLMHQRSMPMEIAGHEYFAPDGKSIWFDLQKPRGQKFYMAGADVATGKEIGNYELTADEWSI
jgi:oligogalacturonide lyase